MGSTLAIFLPLLALALIITAISLSSEEEKKAKFSKLESVVSRNQSRSIIKLDHHEIDLSTPASNQSLFRFKVSMTWENCSSNGEIAIQDLVYSPEPVQVPGYLWLGIRANVLHDLHQIPLQILMYKKVFGFWVKVPCENGVGSCTYRDMCTEWPMPSPCPNVYPANGIPCSCPFKAGQYHLPLSKLFPLEKGALPSWLEKGDYKVITRVDSPDALATWMCVTTYMTIQTD